MFTISCRKLRSTYSTTGKLKCQYIWLLAQRWIPSSPPQRQRLGPVRRLLTLIRASHPVRHRWPLRNHRFFCSRLRVALLEERLGMQTPGHIEGSRNESGMTLIDEALVQFGGKIGAHNLQKFGAEFRSALGKLPHVLQVPFGKPCGPRATISIGVTRPLYALASPMSCPGRNTTMVLPLRTASVSPEMRTIASEI